MKECLSTYMMNEFVANVYKTESHIYFVKVKECIVKMSLWRISMLEAILRKMEVL